MSANLYHVEIKIDENLNPSWKTWFEDLDLSAEPDTGSRMSGDLSDQAALHGVFNRIRDLNLHLVSIEVTRIHSGKE
jgi:hypothetical protein